MNYLPVKLAKLRKHYNFSQNYIANVLGISVVDYMGIENGRNVLNHEQIIKLSKFYHINYIELFKNDDKVTLYKVDKQDTDKINIEYFIPKNTLLNRIKRFVKNNKLVTGIGIGVVAVALILLVVNILLKEPVVNEIHDINTLSVSNKTVLYLNRNGAAKGSGDNSSSQISNLPTENVTKVLANDEYSVFLLNDGTLFVCGDCDEELKEDLVRKKDVIDIAMGDNHIVLLNNDGSVTCLGNNENKQCDINNTQRVTKIFAGGNASIAINEEGKTVYSGDFVGKSTIADVLNIQDVDFSGTTIVYLKEDGTVDYNSNDNSKKNYIECLKWKDIVDVACGIDFVVGLKKDGSVVVASDDPNLKDAESLSDVIAIDAADNYFVAYDGTNIYGYGENRYNQFISSPTATTKLNEVSNIQVTCSKENVVVSFDSVNNATAYEVKLNDYVKQYQNNVNISLDASSLNKGDKYTIIIKVIGDRYYVDSNETKYEFEYQYEEEVKPEEKQEEKQPEVTEETITITSDLLSMTKEEFEAYLSSNNIASIASESEDACSSDKITISDIEGIEAGKTYKKSELEQLLVTYRYCKIELGE